MLQFAMKVNSNHLLTKRTSCVIFGLCALVSMFIETSYHLQLHAMETTKPYAHYTHIHIKPTTRKNFIHHITKTLLHMRFRIVDRYYSVCVLRRKIGV